MGQELGRISGVMLKDNLERLGIDLSVDDDLLYLDVNNNSIGINTTSTNNQTALNVATSILTADLTVDTALILPSVTIKTNTNTIAATVGNLNLASGSSIISPNIRTDDININDNVISSTTSNQTIQIRPNAAGSVEILSDLTVTGNIQANGNVFINGSAIFREPTFQMQDQIYTFGDMPFDTVQVIAPVDSNLIPSDHNAHSLGTGIALNKKRWKKVYANSSLVNNNCLLSSNEIKTTESNLDLQLSAFVGSLVQVTNNTVFNNVLTVDNITAFKNTVIGNTTLVSSLSFSGSNYLSLSAAQTIGTQAFTFECFFNTTNNGLQTLLGASTTGGMSIWLFGDGINPVTIIQIDRSYVDAAQYIVSPITINTWHHIAVIRDSSNNMSVFLDGVKATGSTSNTANYTGPSGLIGAVAGSSYNFIGYLTQIKLAVGSNYYDPTASSISVPTTSLETSTNTKLLLIVANSGAYLTDTSGTQTVSNIGGVTYSASGPSTSTIIHIGNTVQTGNRTVSDRINLTGNMLATDQAAFETITVSSSLIATTESNADLELDAAGTGKINVPTSDVIVQHNLSIGGEFLAGNITTSGSITTSNFINADIDIFDNIVTTIGLDQDLLFKANAAGTVLAIASVRIENNLQINALTTLDDIVIVGDRTHTGNTDTVGSTNQIGNYSLSNNLTVSLGAQFANIKIENNVITTTDSNSDLELRASGTGLVKVDDDFTIENNLNVNGIIATNGLTNSGIIESNTFSDNDIEISTNVIKTTVGNNDLILLAAGTGVISVPNDAVEFHQNLTVNGITDMTSVQIGQGNTTIGLIQTLNNPNASGSSQNDNFANVLAVSGIYAIVGTPLEQGAGGRGEPFSGYAYIFDVTTGALVHTLVNPNAFGLNRFDMFGWSVAISGNYAIVGTRSESDAGGTSSGKAYVFNVTTGALVHTLDNPNAYGTSANDQFGRSVAISGNYAIVGAPLEDDAGGTASGKAYVFNVTTGALLHTLDNPNAYGTSAGDQFGQSIAISGNYAIFGVSGEVDAVGTLYAGKAYIFNVTTGALVHTLDNPNAYGTSASDQFGQSIAISGNYAIVGTRSESDAGGTSSGKAYVFNVTTGALLHTLDNPNAYGTSVSDYFGESVAISGDYAIIGVEEEDDVGGITSGKAYIFNVTTGALLHTLDNPNAYGISQYDRFGTAVAISGDYIIIGAVGEDDAGGNGSGKAYVFSGLRPATLTVTGTINRTGNTTETGNYTLSNNLTVSGTVSLTNIEIDNNVITTTDLNSDLDLRAAASGLVYFANDDVTISNNLRVNGTTTTATIDNSQTVFSNVFTNNIVTVSQNLITTETDVNLRLTAAGLGNVTTPRFAFTNNSINATTINNSVNLTVSAGGVAIPTSSALRIPTGTTANQTSNAVGEIRLNTTETLFTGWNNARVTFGGVFSTDRRTTVLADLTANTLNFTINTALALTLSNSGLSNTVTSVDNNIRFSGNTVAATALNSSITLTPNNDGKLILGNITINANNIQNIDTESTITLQNTGNGYVAFGGSGGIALPAGDDLSRPTDPELGDFRFNTNLSTAEIFNGVEYVTLGGTSGALLNAAEIEEITNLMALVLG